MNKRKKMKKNFMILFFLMGIAGTCTISMRNVNAAEATVVEPDDFPDIKLRQYAMDNFDTDKNGVLSEAEIVQAKELTLFYADNSCSLNMMGIEKLPYLNKINISYVYKIDNIENLRYLSELESLRITPHHEFHEITHLDVSQNKKLKILEVSGLSITELNVSDNEMLEILDCSGTNIKVLDLSRNSKLKRLNCAYTQLKKLNLDAQKAQLEELKCDNMTKFKQKNWKISGFKKLNQLECSNTPLKTLVVEASNLKELAANNCGIKKINISSLKKLTSCLLDKNKLTSLNVSKNKNLKELSVDYNPIKKLNVKNNKKLEDLYCKNTKLRTLDVTKNKKLRYLFCMNNQLSKLDITKNKNLKELDCTKNKIQKLNLKKNKQLNKKNVKADKSVKIIWK